MGASGRRGKEGMRERGNEGTRGRGDEGTRERGSEGTNGDGKALGVVGAEKLSFAAKWLG
jgi:hypothetical protein